MELQRIDQLVFSRCSLCMYAFRRKEADARQALLLCFKILFPGFRMFVRLAITAIWKFGGWLFVGWS